MFAFGTGVAFALAACLMGALFFPRWLRKASPLPEDARISKPDDAMTEGWVAIYVLLALFWCLPSNSFFFGETGPVDWMGIGFGLLMITIRIQQTNAADLLLEHRRGLRVWSLRPLRHFART
jgi:hypothetical protein